MHIKIGKRKIFMRILKSAVAILSIPIIYLTAASTLPYIEPFFSKVAVISAGISFFEGGKSLVLNEAENNGYELADDVVINDTDEVTYSEPEQEASSESLTETEPSSIPSSEPVSETVKPENAGTIKRQTYKAGTTSVYIPLNDGFIKNCTTIGVDKIQAAIAKKPKFKIAANSKPEVLIMHTHATESYQMENTNWFSKSYSSRTTDNTKNMIRVGDEIEKQLTDAGIGVIHDKTLHDYPSYNGAYERSAETVKRILKENPTIKVVLDVHRDAIQPDPNTMIAPVTEIDGRSCAQVMIISGCDNGKFNMPNYMENLKFSASLARQMEKNYPTLSRPILFDYRKYNQNLTTGSILLEMGGHANTLDEAIYAGELVGKSLAEVLLSLK